MNDEDKITKADLNATETESKLELTEAFAEVRECLTRQLLQMEANLIAAFRSYD
jgi:hypothetical protein